MAHETTPSPTPRLSTPVAPSTPGAHPTMRVQRNTPIPSTPGGRHRRISSTPHTPGANTLACISLSTAFITVTVKTAKCSECDLRNKDTMLRCPGCTFQVCKPCQDRREAGGRSLEHGNMLSPQVATPSGGSVVRKRPIATVRSVAKEGEKRNEKIKTKQKNEKEELGLIEAKMHKTNTVPKAKPKPKVRARDATPPSEDSSDENFVLNPASPTTNKRCRIDLTSKNDGANDVPSPFLKPTGENGVPTGLSFNNPKVTAKTLSEMTVDELLAYHGVNTPHNPYKAHLMSRHEQVASNRVIEMPAAVKRGFKPRPTAEEIQKNIQDRVRAKLGLASPIAVAGGSEQ